MIHAPLDEELLDIQSQLHVFISQLQCQSYCYAKMRQLRDGLIDYQCQSHLFFQASHPTYARSNVVRVKQGYEWIMDPTTIFNIRVHYYKEFIGPQLLMTNEVSRACHESYDVVGCIVHDLISHELDADFTEDEVDTVLRHFPSGKSPGSDGLTNEVFKRYSII